MEIQLNKKSIISILILLILSVVVLSYIYSRNPFTNTNGDDGKLPGIIIGANTAKEGVKKAVTHCFKQISPKRHVIQNIGKQSRPHSNMNTVVDKKIVNLAKDVKDINAGLASRTGNLFKLPNGNVYEAKSIAEGANLIPIKGNGMYTLSRAQFTILRELKLKGGLSDDFYRWFNPQLKSKTPYTQDDLKMAVDI